MKKMTIALVAVVAAFSVYGASLAQDAPPAQATKQVKQEKRFNPRRLHQLKNLKSIEVTINKHKFKVWLMDDESKIMEGMMHLEDKDVDADEGMLFVFQKDLGRSFWMRNTLIPLDIAFVNSKRILLNIGKGEALNEESVYSKGPAKYVLEFKQGTLKKLGVTAGMKVEMPDDLKSDYNEGN